VSLECEVLRCGTPIRSARESYNFERGKKEQAVKQEGRPIPGSSTHTDAFFCVGRTGFTGFGPRSLQQKSVKGFRDARLTRGPHAHLRVPDTTRRKENIKSDFQEGGRNLGCHTCLDENRAHSTAGPREKNCNYPKWRSKKTRASCAMATKKGSGQTKFHYKEKLPPHLGTSNNERNCLPQVE